MLLRALTEKLDILHEAQVLQLKMYPPVLYGASKFTLKLDLEGKKIHYELQSNPPDLNGTEIDQLSSWVKTLLGDRWSVDVQVNCDAEQGN